MRIRQRKLYQILLTRPARFLHQTPHDLEVLKRSNSDLTVLAAHACSYMCFRVTSWRATVLSLRQHLLRSEDLGQEKWLDCTFSSDIEC